MDTVVSTDGTGIAYRVSGVGAPLVLVHGVSSDHTAWEPVLPHLCERFTVYALDRRGRGRSGDGRTYTLEQEFQDIVAVVDRIAEPVHLFGHSFGGLCALEASLLTSNLCSLVVYEPSVPSVFDYWPEEFSGRLQAYLDAGEAEKALSAFYTDIVKSSTQELEAIRSLPTWQTKLTILHTIQRELEAMGSFSLDPERYSSIQVPTLLLLGGDSPPHRQVGIDLLHSIIPHSQVKFLEGQQHVAHQTAPTLFARVIRDFLTEQRGQGMVSCRGQDTW